MQSDERLAELEKLLTIPEGKWRVIITDEDSAAGGPTTLSEEAAGIYVQQAINALPDLLRDVRELRQQQHNERQQLAEIYWQALKWGRLWHSKAFQLRQQVKSLEQDSDYIEMMSGHLTAAVNERDQLRQQLAEAQQQVVAAKSEYKQILGWAEELAAGKVQPDTLAGVLEVLLGEARQQLAECQVNYQVVLDEWQMVIAERNQSQQQLAECQAQVAAMRQALEWYAVKRRYWTTEDSEQTVLAEVLQDRGQRARDVLE